MAGRILHLHLYFVTRLQPVSILGQPIGRISALLKGHTLKQRLYTQLRNELILPKHLGAYIAMIFS